MLLPVVVIDHARATGVFDRSDDALVGVMRLNWKRPSSQVGRRAPASLSIRDDRTSRVGWRDPRACPSIRLAKSRIDAGAGWHDRLRVVDQHGLARSNAHPSPLAVIACGNCARVDPLTGDAELLPASSSAGGCSTLSTQVEGEASPPARSGWQGTSPSRADANKSAPVCVRTLGQRGWSLSCCALSRQRVAEVVERSRGAAARRRPQRSRRASRQGGEEKRKEPPGTSERDRGERKLGYPKLGVA